MSSKNFLAVKSTLDTLCNKSIHVTVRSSSVWSQDRIIKSPLKSIEVPKCTVYDYVWQNLEKWPERTLSVCAVTGRGYTYEQVFKLSNTFAANLRKKFKIRDGDVITLMLPNVPDFPVAAMAVLEAGGVLSTINPIYTPNEIQRQLQSSGSKLIITLPDSVTTIKEAFKLGQFSIPIIAIKTNGDPLPEGTVCFNELSEDVSIDKSCLKEVRRGPDDICFLPYSSGTTGLPKGVELINRNIVANCEQINDCSIRAHNDTTPTHQDVMICVLPFYHIYGATVLMFHKMSQGVKLVTLAKFHPETYLQTLEKQKVNIVYLAPPLVLLMASHPSSSPKTFEHLETIVSGAAPLTSTDVERLLHKAERTFDFRQGYGMTETSPVVCMTPRGVTAYNSVGPAIPSTELKIVDPDLNPLGPNQTGELLVRGPQVMRGYRNNPQANAESFTEDGWFRSGDLAVVDESGHVTIADRLKELIKVKGLQVPPAELEGILRDHPAVSDAAVIGVPHPSDGETPRAFVVLKQGQKPETQGILDFVKYKVAPYKMITEVTFVETIPKNATGKIMRKELKEKYC